MLKTRNIIIFVIIVGVLTAVYFLFIRSSPDQATLVSTTPSTLPVGVNASDPNGTIAKDFLSLLLSVNSIKLDDSILTDPAFINLRDSSIVLTPDGTQGRPNPFAQFGTDTVLIPTAPSDITQIINTPTPITTTPVTAPTTPTPSTTKTTTPITTPKATTTNTKTN